MSWWLSTIQDSLVLRQAHNPVVPNLMVQTGLSKKDEMGQTLGSGSVQVTEG